MTKEKCLVFDNVRETLLELYSNGKDVNAQYDIWYDTRYTNKIHEGFEQMIFTNHYRDNLDIATVLVSAECIGFELFSHRGDYRIEIWIELTNGMILRIPLMSKKKKDVMTAGLHFTSDSANELYSYIKDIRHPKIREFVNHLFFRVISPSVTINQEEE